MKIKQHMSAPPPWYKADDPGTETKDKITLVSYWSTHAFHVANCNGFYYFADPIGCDARSYCATHHKTKIDPEQIFSDTLHKPGAGHTSAAVGCPQTCFYWD